MALPRNSPFSALLAYFRLYGLFPYLIDAREFCHLAYFSLGLSSPVCY